MDYKYNGIILGKKDVGETDRIYTILTFEAGKIKVLGKGARRPNAKLAGHLEPITYSEIFLSKSKGAGKLTGAATIENFSKLKIDIESLVQVAYTVKVLGKIIPEQQEEKKIFNSLIGYLTVMENLSDKGVSDKKEIVTLGFLFKLLENSGYKIEIKECVICGSKLRPSNNYFSVSRGGVMCGNCHKAEAEKIKIEDSSIKFMRLFGKNKISSLEKLNSSKKDIDDLSKIIKKSIAWAIE